MTPTLPDGWMPPNHFVPIKEVPKAKHDDATPPHLIAKVDDIFRTNSPVRFEDHDTKRKRHTT